MSLSDFITKQLSFEEYAFNWHELVQGTSSKSESLIRNDLYYAVGNGDIVSLRHKFYLIIPQRYSHTGKLSIELYIDKLFSFLNRNYYLGLYSAASYYGASHQQIQKEYIIQDKSPLLSVSKGAIKLDFLTVSNWPEKNVLSRKGDVGMFKISSPALTAVDLLYHQSKNWRVEQNTFHFGRFTPNAVNFKLFFPAFKVFKSKGVHIENFVQQGLFF